MPLEIKQDWVKKKSTAIVGLIALVLFQISSAAHQFDHTISDSAEACELCVQLDRSGDAPAASATSLELAPGTSLEVLSSSWIATVAPANRQRIRGPPIV